MVKSYPKVYLAGPITGGSYGGVTGWRDEIKRILGDVNIIGFSPMRHKEYLLKEKEIADNYNQHYMSTITAINIRDCNDVKTSDAILVNFIGATKVSIGTVMEIAWARAFGIPVIIAIDDQNVHQHGMLLYHAIVVNNLDDAVIAIKSTLLP